MADEGQKKTDKEIAKVEKQLTSIYGQAQKEIEQKIKDFDDKFKVKKSIYYQKYKNHEINQKDYNSWLAGQKFQSNEWKAKQDQICKILHNANTQATNIVNGGTVNAFASGANWTAYKLEHDQGVNFGFGLYDAKTVTNLVKNDPQILPKWKINEPKEYIWNKQKVNNCVTQGIIQGEGVQDIGKRIATVTCNQNKNLAMTHAQTAMAGAQNSGRMQRLQDAKQLGINVVKQWMATLDKHTRDTHAEIDGEQQPVGDKWHHIKFSNGCEYPGDPNGPAHEVFNCRCTLVGDIADYPEEYQRYDNIDGEPIDNMSYSDWEKAKFADEHAKENEKELQKLDKKIDAKKQEIEDLQQKIKDAGADKTFPGIWYNQEVTYADYESKKDSIQAKKDYYDSQIEKYQQNGQTDMVEKMEEKKAELEEFEKNGEEYSKMLDELNEKKDELSDLNAEHKELANEGSDSPFGDDAYSQERKDDALWAQSPREADESLRSVCGEVWQNASNAEKDAIYDYTGSYHKFNEPLRGIEYGTNAYLGVGNTDLDAGRAHNGAQLNAMTDIINKSSYDHDMWLQRGCRYDGMDKFFGCDMDLLRRGSQKDLERELLGTTPTEYGFMSCGSSKGRGLNTDAGILLNVYAPSGTKMMYAEPFSQFGSGDRRHWDGKSKQSSFGRELETILQQGTQFRVIKVERSYGKLYVDLEVIDQSKQQRYKP